MIMVRAPKQLSSSKNPDIKRVVQLRDRKHRDRAGLTIVEGAREIAAAASSSVDIKELYICRELFKDGNSGALAKRISSHVPLREVTKEVFAKIAYGERMEGILAICAIPRRDLKELMLSAEPLLVIIEHVEKPGNLGAILRTCDGVGVDGVIVCDKGTDLYNPNVIRSSLGIIFSVPVVTASNESALEFLRQKNIEAYATFPQADLLYAEADFRKSSAIVLGSEERGLSNFWKNNSSLQIKIPMKGKSDSLNVATTAAVVLYEALRQRTSRR